MQHDIEDHGEAIFVARQPIFNRDEELWGYELLFRHSGQAGVAVVADPDQATAKVIADGFALASNGVPADKHLLINFPANLILNGAFHALPSKTCIIEILETVEPTPEILAALKSGKHHGYTLALDDFVGQSGFESILKIADIIKVDVMGQSHDALARITKDLKRGNAKLLAEKIEDRETFLFLHKLGYQFFQGFFFAKPEIIPGRKISSGALQKMRLLQELSKGDYEVKDLGAIISTDVSLSYRLLNYLNSAAFGLRRSIESINQAITILGSRSTRQWLMVVILSDLNPSAKAAELSLQSVHRARFFQAAVEAGAQSPHSSDSMFLLGLLSRLDALLGHYMKDILAKLPLDEGIKNALLKKENTLGTWLLLAEAMEAAEWEKAETYLKELDLPLDKAATLHAEAAYWAFQLLQSS